MKVADVYWRGRGNRHSRRGPSDQRYNWLSTTSDVDDIPVEMDSVEDAAYFADLENFEVRWTPLGRLAKATDGHASEAEAALEQIGYRQKQRMAKSLGVRADGSEDELTERLAPEVEDLREQMEANKL